MKGKEEASETMLTEKEASQLSDTEFVGARKGRDIFADVGLLPGLCGFLLAAPEQKHTTCSGRSDPQLTSWREGPTKERPQNIQNPKTYRDPT